MSVVYIKTAESYQDIMKYSKAAQMLTDAQMPYGLVLIFFDDETYVEGCVRTVSMTRPTLSTYSGYVILDTENGQRIIDLLDIKYVKNIANEKTVAKYVEKGIIKILRDEDHQEFLKTGSIPLC